MPYKNSSQIVIGDRSTYYKRQFVSTNQNTFVNPKQFETQNPGIISAKTIRNKHLQELWRDDFWYQIIEDSYRSLQKTNSLLFQFILISSIKYKKYTSFTKIKL